MIPGRKLEYEIKNRSKDENEQNFMTGVEFSTEYPYGKAVALLNLKFCSIEVCCLIECKMCFEKNRKKKRNLATFFIFIFDEIDKGRVAVIAWNHVGINSFRKFQKGSL